MDVMVHPQTYSCGRCKRNFQERVDAECCCTEYTRELHTCVDIVGLMRLKNLDGFMDNAETGEKLSDAEAREYLQGCLDKGWEVLPTCDCVDFDYQKGCRGRTINQMEGSRRGRNDRKD